MADDSDEDPCPGYQDGVSYASAPRTRYQARAREGIAEDADVELHYTARYTEIVVERVCNVAIKPGADWRSLPRQLEVKKPDSAAAKTTRDTRFSRVDGSGHFRTAMTTVQPHSQGATVLHPTVGPLTLLQGHFIEIWGEIAKASTHRPGVRSGTGLSRLLGVPLRKRTAKHNRTRCEI